MSTPRPWSVVYSDTGRTALASATPEERAAVLDVEKQLATNPLVGELYPDRVGGLYVTRIDVGGRRGWTSVLYRVDDTAGEVLIVALVSGP